MKQKTIWCCAECGQIEPRWSGQCKTCGKWNTFHEEIEYQKRFDTETLTASKPVRIHEVKEEKTSRMTTGISEFDRLVGGGVMKGSFSLVGGDPGIGKSTLLLQVAAALAKQGFVVLYVCAEESVAQTSMRAKRLQISDCNLFLLSETNFSLIKNQIDQIAPDFVVIDSIQIIYKSEISSAPGSVSQVRECAVELMHLAKGRGIAIFIIGHVTKSGEIAGPRVLEHLVDTVLYFEGDRQYNYRMLRVVKNRFGSTDEIAVFRMVEEGLEEITNPSEIFLEERMKGNTGSVIIPTLEGSRPILIEVQALVTNTAYTTPSRRCQGLDSNRLALLLAVLEKRVGFQLHNRDVFVSVAGGFRVTEPAIDLGVIFAIASSLTNRKIDPETVIIGEVGLGGEIRSVPRLQERLKEAANMGFKKAFVPKRNLKEQKHIVLTGIDWVEEGIRAAIG